VVLRRVEKFWRKRASCSPGDPFRALECVGRCGRGVPLARERGSAAEQPRSADWGVAAAMAVGVLRCWTGVMSLLLLSIPWREWWGARSFPARPSVELMMALLSLPVDGRWSLSLLSGGTRSFPCRAQMRASLGESVGRIASLWRGGSRGCGYSLPLCRRFALSSLGRCVERITSLCRCVAMAALWAEWTDARGSALSRESSRASVRRYAVHRCPARGRLVSSMSASGGYRTTRHARRQDRTRRRTRGCASRSPLVGTLIGLWALIGSWRLCTLVWLAHHISRDVPMSSSREFPFFFLIFFTSLTSPSPFPFPHLSTFPLSIYFPSIYFPPSQLTLPSPHLN
jgi:hypothetical protein